MASERQCNKIRKQDQQEKAALGHKVKIHQFFSFYHNTVFNQYV